MTGNNKRRRYFQNEVEDSSVYSSLLSINSNFDEIYGSPEDPHISLETQPEENLLAIFEFLGSSSLLKLCQISKDFYLPASICLYQRILITTKREFKHVRKDTDTWVIKNCTATCKAKKLVQCLSTDKRLASYTECLIIHFDDDEERPWLPLLTVCPNIKEIHNRGHTYSSEGMGLNLNGATFNVIRCPAFGPKLRELRLVFEGNTPITKASFKALAISMVEAQAHVNLRTLIMEHEYPNHYGVHRYKDEYFRTSTPWFYFIEIFWLKGIQLNLDTLGVCGSFHHETGFLCRCLHKMVNFENLKTLELKFNESPHFVCYHESLLSPPAGFMVYLTKDAKSLKHLYLDFRIDCKDCFTLFIKNCLTKILKNQLETLSLHTSSYEDFDYIIALIVYHQYNLRKLDVYQFGGRMHSGETSKEISYVSSKHERVIFGRKFYTPCFKITQASRPFISEKAEGIVRNNLEAFAHFFEWDSIYHNRHQISRHLREYCINGLHLNIRDNCLLLNNHSFSLNMNALSSGNMNLESDEETDSDSELSDDSDFTF